MTGVIQRKGALLPVSVAPQRAPEPALVAAEERTVALTVKVPATLYTRLKRFGAERRRTTQDIGVVALRSYLDGQEA